MNHQREPASSFSQSEFDLGIESPPAAASQASTGLDLTLKSTPGRPLGPAQIEFNKRLKALEKACASLERKRGQLDKHLVACRDVLMPLVERRNRSEYEVILLTHETRKSLKLTKRRSAALDDLILTKISGLLEDPVGLGEEETAALDALYDEIAPPEEDNEPYEEVRMAVREEFETMRGMVEDFAQMSGVNLDLSGLDPEMDALEFEEELRRRFAAADEECHRVANGSGAPPKRKRKPTKAALERERLRQEAEEAKKRDFKSLYKQLAKVLHPDLEADSTLKRHKEAWMKRLTAAHAAGDLREMLTIEMEWLGEEAGNLTKASDEKLRVYSMVLKEQLDEIKEQTELLSHQPEYIPLRRFMGPFEKRLDVYFHQLDIQGKIDNLADLLAILRKGGTAARKLIHQSADRHAGMLGL